MPEKEKKTEDKEVSTADRIAQLRNGLLQYKEVGTLDVDLPDEEQFIQDFQNSSYRRQFHDWLVMQQSQGKVQDIPLKYQQFNNHFFPKPDPVIEINEHGEQVIDGVVQQPDVEFDPGQLSGRIRRIAEGDISALENLNDMQTAQLAEALGLEKARLDQEVSRITFPVPGAPIAYNSPEDKDKESKRTELMRAYRILERRGRDESDMNQLQKVVTSSMDLLEMGTLSVATSVVAAREMLTDEPEAEARLTDVRQRLQQSMHSYAEGIEPMEFRQIGKRDGYVYDFNRWATSNLVGMVPVVGSIFAGGAVGGKAGAVLGKPGIIAGSIIGSFTAGYTLYTGDLYSTLIDEDIDKDVAKRTALIYGAPAAAVSIIFPAMASAAILGGLGKTFVKNKIKEALLGAAIATPGEGIAEGIAEYFVILGEQEALGIEYTREEITDRIINAAAVGALMGLGTGSVGGAGRPRGTVDQYVDGFLNATNSFAEPTPEMQYVRQQVEFSWNPDAPSDVQIKQLTEESKRLQKRLKEDGVSTKEHMDIGYAIDAISEQIFFLKGGQPMEKMYALRNRPVVINHLKRELLRIQQDKGLTENQQSLLNFLDNAEKDAKAKPVSNKAMRENIKMTDEIIVEVVQRTNQENLTRLQELEEKSRSRETTFEEQIEMSAIIFNRPTVFQAFQSGTPLSGEGSVNNTPGVPTGEKPAPAPRSAPRGPRPLVSVTDPASGQVFPASEFGDESWIYSEIEGIITEGETMEEALAALDEKGIVFSEEDTGRISEFIEDRFSGRQEMSFAEWMESHTEDGTPSPTTETTVDPTTEAEGTLDTGLFEQTRQETDQKRQDLSQRGTIGQAVGTQVTFGEYSGQLQLDGEGNFVIETADGTIVEVTDAQKNPDTPLADIGVQRAISQFRNMRLNDFESGSFTFEQTNPQTGEVTSESFTFVESNTNDAGEVVSVTMENAEGQKRTFRSPEIVEQVIWQNYFAQAENAQSALEAELSDPAPPQDPVDPGVTAGPVTTPDQLPGFTLDDGDPRINTVFDKFEAGEKLTPQEQQDALAWASEKIDALSEANPNNLNDLLNQLEQFENEVIANEPAEQTPDLGDGTPPTPQDAIPEPGTGGTPSPTGTPASPIRPTDSGRPAGDPRPTPPSPAGTPTPDPAGQPVTPTKAELLEQTPVEMQTLSEYLGRVEAELSELMAENPESATRVINKLRKKHRQFIADAIDNGQAIPEDVLQDYPDLARKMEIDDSSSAPVDAKPSRPVKQITREYIQLQLQEQVDAGNITQAQAGALMTLLDTRAEIWGKQNGRDPSDYYRMRFNDITGISNPGVVSDVLRSYDGEYDSVDSILDAMNAKVNQPIPPDADSFVTEDGDRVHYKSAIQGNLFDTETPLPSKDPKDAITRELDPATGEFATQERVFDTIDVLPLHSGKSKIETAGDVAWMFHALENESVEHFFIVAVDANGVPTPIHISMGDIASASVDLTQIGPIIAKFNPVHLYHVHNHPSGVLQASSADINIAKRISEIAKSFGIKTDGIIIDRDSGQFVHFVKNDALITREYASDNYITNSRLRKLEIERQGLKPIPTQRYGRFRLLGNPMGDTSITDVYGLGEYIDTKKLSPMDKDAIILTDHSQNVQGFVHLRNPILTPNGTPNPAAVAEIQALSGRFGTSNAFIVTNRGMQDMHGKQPNLKKFIDTVRVAGVSVNDIVSVSVSQTYSRAGSIRSKFHGVFERDNPVLYRGTENAQTFTNEEQAISYLFENETSFEGIVQNLAPIFERDLSGNDRMLVEKWAGAKDGVWNKGAYDKFAQGLTEYLAEGNAPTKRLKKIFAQFKEWLNNIYQVFTENDSLVLNDEIRGVLDRLFTGTIQDLRNDPIPMTNLGSEITVDWFADGKESHPGHFAVVDLGSVNASHHPNGNKNERHIISRAQPRDRSSAEAIQNQERNARDMNPAYNTGNNGTAFHGAPVVNQHGEAIQGNGRLISIQITSTNYPGKYNAYKQYLIEHAAEFGLDPDFISGFSRPVLVRMLNVSDKEAVRLGSIQNNAELEMPPEQRALAAIRNMSEDDKRIVGGLIENSRAETFRAVLDEIGIQILDRVLPERGNFLNNRGELTVQGKNFIEDVFKAMVFDSEVNPDAIRIFDRLPVPLQNAIAKNYGTILRFYDTPADLRMTLQKAIDIVYKVQTNKDMADIDDLFQSANIFDSPLDQYTETDRMLATVLFDSMNPGSDMMKALKTTGTQHALRLVFDEYKAQIYGRKELFNENTIEPKGNTPEGAEQAFLETFNRRNKPQQPEPLRPKQEPGRQDDGQGAPGEILSRLADENVNDELINQRSQDPKEQLLMAGYLPKIVNALRKKGPKQLKITSRQDVTNHIIEKMGVSIGVGRSRALLNALGFYRLKPYGHAIRMRVANDISVLAHEVGHYLHDVLFGTLTTHPQFDKELMALGQRTSRADYTPDQVRMEGQAEFFRYMVTNNIVAKQIAPVYYEFFTKELSKDPLLRRSVDELVAMVDAYASQDGPTRLRSHIAYDDTSPTKTGPQGESLPQYLYRQILDDLIPLRRAREDLLTGENEIDSEQYSTDAFRLAQLNKGIPGLMQGWIEFGVRNTRAEKVHKGLKQILQDAGVEGNADRMNFEDYLIARRTIELYTQAEQGERTLKKSHGQEGGALGISKEDAEATFAKFNSPEFENAAQEIYEWTNATLEWAVDRGYMNDTDLRAMQQMNQNYIPMHRVMDYLDAKGADQKASMVNKPSLWQKISGSGRRILPPLTTLVRNTQRMMYAVEQNYAAVQMFEDIRNAKKGGVYADKVSRPMKPVKGSLEEVQKALIEAGLDPDVMSEIELGTTFTLFRPIAHNPKKRELVIRRNGKPEIWQVHSDALYEALVGHGPKATNPLRILLTGPKSVFRRGVVISLNFISSVTQRDQFVAHGNSRYGYAFLHLNPFEKDFGSSDYFKGMAAILSNSEEYQLWLQSKAGISGIVDVQSDQVARTIDQLSETPAQTIARNIINPARWLQGMEAFSAVFENSTRVGEFLRAIAVEGRDEEGLVRGAIAAREVGADYARGGQWAKNIGQYKAFFNAGLQGDLAIAQAIKRDPVGFSIKMTMAMAIPTLALNYAMKENPDYMEREEERMAYWLIPMGDPRTTTDWWRVRKPWRLGTFFGTVLPNAIETASGIEDGNMIQQMFPTQEDAMGALADLIPSAILPLAEVMTNYSFFYQRNIDPFYENNIEPYLRFDDRNSEVEKLIGKTLNVSPRKVRHLIRGYSGTIGVDISDITGGFLTDLLQRPEDPPAPERDRVQEIPGLQVFFSRDLAAGRSKSLQQFRSLLDESRTKKNTERLKEGTPDGDSYYDENSFLIDINPALERTNRVISGIRKDIEQVYLDQRLTPAEKRQLLREYNYSIIEVARDAVKDFEGESPSRSFFPRTDIGQ